MTFYEAAIEKNYSLMFEIHQAMTPIEQLFSYKLYKLNFNECCGGDFARYCKSKQDDYFNFMITLKSTLGLGGDCGEWHEEVALTFSEYQKFLKEVNDVKDRI